MPRAPVCAKRRDHRLHGRCSRSGLGRAECLCQRVRFAGHSQQVRETDQLPQSSRGGDPDLLGQRPEPLAERRPTQWQRRYRPNSDGLGLRGSDGLLSSRGVSRCRNATGARPSKARHRHGCCAQARQKPPLQKDARHKARATRTQRFPARIADTRSMRTRNVVRTAATTSRRRTPLLPASLGGSSLERCSSCTWSIGGSSGDASHVVTFGNGLPAKRSSGSGRSRRPGGVHAPGCSDTSPAEAPPDRLPLRTRRRPCLPRRPPIHSPPGRTRILRARTAPGRRSARCEVQRPVNRGE